MPRIVLDIELAKKTVNIESGVFGDGKKQGYSFCPPKNIKPQSKPFGAQETCTEMWGTVEDWIAVSLQRFFLEQ